MPMGSGKTVTLSLLAYPCRASLHQLKGRIPNLGMAWLWSHIKAAFSSRLRRPIRSSARCSNGSLGSLNG